MIRWPWHWKMDRLHGEALREDGSRSSERFYAWKRAWRREFWEAEASLKRWNIDQLDAALHAIPERLEWEP